MSLKLFILMPVLIYDELKEMQLKRGSELNWLKNKDVYVKNKCLVINLETHWLIA